MVESLSIHKGKKLGLSELTFTLNGVLGCVNNNFNDFGEVKLRVEGLDGVNFLKC